MSRNAKLESSVITLNPSNAKTKVSTYSNREFFISKLGLDETVTDAKIVRELHKEIFKNPDYYENEKLKKAFRLTNQVRAKASECIIHGVIEGGLYDSGKSSGKRRSRNASEKFDRDTIIQDDFYFLLHINLDSKKSILILQSYSTDNIRIVFEKFMKKVFRHKGSTFDAKIQPFVPAAILEKAQTTAIITELKYSSKDVPLEHVSNRNKIESFDNLYDLEIRIKPKSDNIKVSDLSTLKSMLSKLNFGGVDSKIALEEFNRQTGVLESEAIQNPTSFKLDSDQLKIKPTVFLSQIDDITYQSNGIPNWESLKNYCCDKLLLELKTEVYD